MVFWADEVTGEVSLSTCHCQPVRLSPPPVSSCCLSHSSTLSISSSPSPSVRPLPFVTLSLFVLAHTGLNQALASKHTAPDDEDLTRIHVSPCLTQQSSSPVLHRCNYADYMFARTSGFAPFFLSSLQAFPVYPSVAPLASLSSECASQRSPRVLQMGALIR